MIKIEGKATVVSLGHGTIVVTTGERDGKIDEVVLVDASERPGIIGCLSDHYNTKYGGVGTDLVEENLVRLQFANSRSVQVVINMLNKVKDDLIAEEGKA